MNEFPDTYKIDGIDVIGIIVDSVTRYFYGEIPPESSTKLHEVRLKYAISTLIGFEASKNLCII